MTGLVSASLWGTIKYEFLMQARRKAVWIAMAIFSLSVFTGTMTPWQAIPSASTSQILADWALTLQVLLPVIFGILMADRLPRDFRLTVSELLRTLPTSSLAHLLGKFFGSAAATALPILLVYTSGVLYLVLSDRDMSVVPLAVAVFATVIVPGLLFVAAFSIACPAIIWVPLYQFLFVGYWFWGNMLNPQFGIPTLSGTLLTPIGDNAAVGFFGTYPLFASGSSQPVLDGVISIALLAGGSVVALTAVHQYLKWARTRQ